MPVNKSYTDDSIRALQGLEAVRARPGMYIGSTDSDGIHHLIWEILDNSVDELINGYATEITLTIKDDFVVNITDNGRGIPTGINPDLGLSNLVVVFTVLHAGGKFDNDAYKTSGGLHGVGSTCVNALSDFLDVTVCRDGKEHRVSFKEGGKIDKEPYIVGDSSKRGTSVTWKPDFSIFDQIDSYDYSRITERLSTLAYLNAGKKFIFINEKEGQAPIEFYYEKGIQSWIEDLNKDRNSEFSLHDVVLVSAKDQVKDRRKAGKLNDISINCAFQYVNDDETIAFSFCNNIATKFGGTHLESFKDGLLASVRKKFIETKRVKSEDEIEKADIFVGLTAVVSIDYVCPEYSGQTKGVLSNVEIKKFIRDTVEEEFDRYLEEHLSDGVSEKILERINQSRNMRLKIEQTKRVDRKLAKEGFLSFAGKLADCTIKDPEFSELFIVEGDSAGGSAKGARNRDFQAILPIKGKLVNVWKKKSKSYKFVDNEEVKNLFAAIGCGYSHGNSKFDISRLKYNKIIIMTDADVDGSHIRTLILTFIYRFMKELVDRGHVYVAQPPLYRATSARKTEYLFDEKAKDKFLSKNQKGWDIGRFKGLGEMSPDQLWETTMDPENRTLLRITSEEVEEAQDRVFDELMGDRVAPRKKFIMANYHRADIDI